MTKGEILSRILGQHRTLDDVRTAFSARHPAIPAYAWFAAAEVKGEVITVTGRIFNGTMQIGHFSRRLMYAKGFGQAIHEIMEIERPHRDNDIAKHPYSRALVFSRPVGIRYVRLDAEGEGPVIWPTFGFDFTRRKHREMLLKILRDWDVNPIPHPASLLAPRIVDINTDEAPELGQLAHLRASRPSK